MEILGAIMLVVAIVFALLETLTTDLTFAMLAGGATAGAVVGFAGGPLWLALIVFAIVSALLLFLLRPYLRKKIKAGEIVANSTNVNALIGVTARAIDDLTPGVSGRIKLNGEVWTAKLVHGETNTVKEGEQVKIFEINGAIALVETIASEG